MWKTVKKILLWALVIAVINTVLTLLQINTIKKESEGKELLNPPPILKTEKRTFNLANDILIATALKNCFLTLKKVKEKPEVSPKREALLSSAKGNVFLYLLPNNSTFVIYNNTLYGSNSSLCLSLWYLLSSRKAR